MQYSDFQNQPSSEKITLVLLNACRRLMGWTVESGSIYKVTDLDVVVDGIEDSGTAYTEVGSIGEVVASTFFYDVATKTIYLRTTGSDNPNGRFIVLRQKLCFANVPIVLPHDLNSAPEVEFLPLLKSTSQFGVAIDVISQDSEAIEGSGSISMVNDSDFWPANYDRLFFDNQDCLVYSYSRLLEPTDAKLIFKGKVEKRSYTPATITFSLKDQFSELRSPLSLPTIGELGARTGSDIEKAFQRTVFGSVTGHLPVNIDQVLEGYPVTGTVSIAFNSTSVSGSGTLFLKELSPDDRLTVDGVEYSIASVGSNTSLVLTEPFTAPSGIAGASITVVPDRPKRHMNREWLVAGHAIREPLTAVQNGSVIDRLFLDDVSDINIGDFIYIGELGSGELTFVTDLLGKNQVRLGASLATIPPIGTSVRRPGIQNVRINDIPLRYFDDYTFDAGTGRLLLRDTAEANAAPIRQLSSNITITSGSRNVTGSGFKNSIFPGYMIGVVNSADFYEVLSVESDTSLTLRTTPTSSPTPAACRYKELVLNPDEDVLSLDVLGRTTTGLSGGTLIKTVPSVVKALLSDAGLADNINEQSFAEAELTAYQTIGLVFPETSKSTTLPTFRDAINLVNKSNFCSLVQNSQFEFSMEVLQPTKPITSARFSEADILRMDFSATGENMIKTAIVEYSPKEYDYLTGESSIQTHQTTSDISSFILKTARTKTFETFLSTSVDAKIHADRWAYILENTAGRINFTTKLQGITLDIGDIIEVEHRKLFQRFGGTDNRRLMLVESVKKSGTTVQIEATDLSNSFNRIAAINTLTNEFSVASEDDKLFGGYYTDQYGLIDNLADTSGINQIW